MELKQAKELVRGRLSDKRYEHTINVKKMAVKLAKHYGTDPEQAALAALLHDAAKELPKDEMRGVANSCSPLVQTVLCTWISRARNHSEIYSSICAAKTASSSQTRMCMGVFPPSEYKKAYSSVPRREKHPICFYITLVPPVRQSKTEQTSYARNLS